MNMVNDPNIRTPPGPQSGFSSGPQKAPSNGLAIAAIILAFIIPLVGLILGIVALVQINKDPSKGGKGLAIASIVLSSVFMLITFVVIAIMMTFSFGMISAISNLNSSDAKIYIDGIGEMNTEEAREYVEGMSEKSSTFSDLKLSCQNGVELSIMNLGDESLICYDIEANQSSIFIANNGSINVSSIDFTFMGLKDAFVYESNEGIAISSSREFKIDYDFEKYGDVYSVGIIPVISSTGVSVSCYESALEIVNVQECVSSN